MIKHSRTAAVLACLASSVAVAQDAPPDPEAGAALAEACATCHGPAGVSTSEDIPNLAAQKQAYLAGELEAFRSGERESQVMNAIATSLSDTDIANLAAHFAGLAGAEPGAVAANPTGLDGSLPGFPADFAETFTEYHRIDFEDRRQVRAYFANAAALAAAEAGGPFPAVAYLLVEIFAAEEDADGNLARGEDGRLVAAERTGFTAMEKQEGWGAEVPELLRNDDWRYTTFTAEGERRDGVNEGPCLACHVPLEETDFTFTFDEIRAAAEAN